MDLLGGDMFPDPGGVFPAVWAKPKSAPGSRGERIHFGSSRARCMAGIRPEADHYPGKVLAKGRKCLRWPPLSSEVLCSHKQPVLCAVLAPCALLKQLFVLIKYALVLTLLWGAALRACQSPASFPAEVGKEGAKACGLRGTQVRTDPPPPPKKKKILS